MVHEATPLYRIEPSGSRGANELRAEAVVNTTEVRVVLAGVADAHAERAVEELFHAVHSAASTHGITAVHVDLVQLEFMSAASFKALVVWMSAVQELEDARRYRVVFRSSARSRWQHRTLTALRCFASELIDVKVT